MTTINYSEVQLKSSEKVVSWSGLQANDDGQEFDLAGYDLISIHTYRPSAGTVKINVFGANSSNGMANPADLGLIGPELINTLGTGGMWNNASKPRFISLLADAGSGSISMDILIKEAKLNG